MIDEIKIRSAKPEDAAALKACIDAAYAIYKDEISDLPDVSAGIIDEISTGNVWVAEAGSKIAGGVFLSLFDEYAQLVNIAVDPQFSGKGIGKRLIAHLEAVCRSENLTEIRLSTHVKMASNISLYQHLGWVETSRTTNKVLMTKRL